jgi:hypothetical protein
VQLPSGNRAWFFSDTFLGSPADRKTLFYYSAIHNSIVMQSGGGLHTITGGNTCQERNTSLSFWSRYAQTPAAAPDGSSGGFYWTGDQMVVGSDVVKFYYHGDRSAFPFAITASAVATIPISQLESSLTATITPLQFTQLCANGPTSIIWGASLLNWGGNVYVYGWSTANRNQLYLARTTAGNLTNPASWQTFNGLDGSGSPVWSSCGNVSPLPITLGSGLSVTSINGSLWLIQKDQASSLGGGPVTAHPAAQPWLFNNSEVVLYYPPEAHHDYPDYFLTYEARLQPGLSGSSSYVVISYNVNSTAVDTGCVSSDMHDASIYRPRFIDVPTSAFNTSSATAVAGAGVLLPAPSYGIMNSGPTSTFPSPAVNAAGTVLDSAASSGARIDGVGDWYDQWGSLKGGCPKLSNPSSLSASAPTPTGELQLTWPTVGTDVWYNGYQEDVTAGSSFSQMWNGLWVTPSAPTATSASGTAAPVTSAGVNGHTFGWYVQAFGAGCTNCPTSISPIASEAVAMQPPAAPTGLIGSNGTGAAGEFKLNWTDVTYPSSAVYYWVYYWDVTAGQTIVNATRAALPAPPGTTSFDFAGWTSSGGAVLTPFHAYGFFVKAENLGGFSPASNDVTVGGSPSCGGGPMLGSGIVHIAANQGLYVYVTNPVAFGTGVQSTASVTLSLGTAHSEKQNQVIKVGDTGVFHFSIFGTPPLTYDINYSESSNAGVTFGTSSTSCK